MKCQNKCDIGQFNSFLFPLKNQIEVLTLENVNSCNLESQSFGLLCLIIYYLGVEQLFVHNSDIILKGTTSTQVISNETKFRQEKWIPNCSFGSRSRLLTLQIESTNMRGPINDDLSIITNTALTAFLINCSIESIENGRLSGWTNIKMLSLEKNKITALNKSWFLTPTKNLWFLDLSHNQIDTVKPGFFDQMTNLTRLILSHNRLTTLDWQSFASISGSLKELSIEGTVSRRNSIS